MKKEDNPKNKADIAFRFKEIRENYFHSKTVRDGKRSDHTQEDLAEYLNVTPQTIRNYENGRSDIPEKHLRKLANECGVMIEYLLGESDFHTLKEKRDALDKKDWDENFITPIEIDRLVGSILEKMGYALFEDDIAGKEFFAATFEIPPNYTIHQHIPPKDLTESFNKTACNIRPQKYYGIRREKDGKMKYILHDRFNALFDDIENYIKYRIEREFK